MATGHKASDWTVEHTGNEGIVACAEYLGRFRIDRDGAVRITWSPPPGPVADGETIRRAAQEAIDAAIRPRA
jgi:hypothetical protein